MTAARNLLLTGTSGVGKSTLLRKVAASLSQRRIRGFISDEIRNHGSREGFRVETLDGQSAVLAHVSLASPYRLGKYGVDIASFESVALPVLLPDRLVDAFLVDEVGPMECFSDRFVQCFADLLDSDQTLVATIHARAAGFVQEVKERHDVELWEVTLRNREEIASSVMKWIDGQQ